MQRLYIRSGKTRTLADEYEYIVHCAAGQEAKNNNLESDLERAGRRYGSAFYYSLQVRNDCHYISGMLQLQVKLVRINKEHFK